MYAVIRTFYCTHVHATLHANSAVSINLLTFATGLNSKQTCNIRQKLKEMLLVSCRLAAADADDIQAGIQVCLYSN